MSFSPKKSNAQLLNEHKGTNEEAESGEMKLKILYLQRDDDTDEQS